MEIMLTLSFACCCCQNGITATLCCKGAGLTEPAEERIAAVNVPCPDCRQMCRLLFDPLEGTIHGVRLSVPNQAIPEPSRN